MILPIPVKMDGIVWIIGAWVAVSILCYFFIYRRTPGPPAINIDSDAQCAMSIESQKSFANDMLQWLVWDGAGASSASPHIGPANQQKLALSPILTKFVLKALNEAAQRVLKESQPEIHFDRIVYPSADQQPMFRNIHVHHPNNNNNNKQGNHSFLSIHTQLGYAKKGAGGEGIRLEISFPTNFLEEDDNRLSPFENGNHQNAESVRMRKIPLLRGPSIKRYTVLIEELSGDVETRLASIAGELFVISCFKARPRVQLRMGGNSNSNLAPNDDVLALCKRCISSAVLNFSIGELLYPDTADASERASRARLSAEYRNLGFLNELYPAAKQQQRGRTPPIQRTSPARSLSPKFPVTEEDLIRPEELDAANRLKLQLVEIYGANFGADAPFVCVEMDEPSGQRFLSTKANRSRDPNAQKVQWEEGRATFEFAISPASNELLFEVFTEEEQQLNGRQGSSTNTIRERKFCGTAILSLDELRRAVLKRHRHIELRLHGRPFASVYGGEPTPARAHRRESHELYGVLVIKPSFYTRHELERPSAPQPMEQQQQQSSNFFQKTPSPFAYAADQQQQQPKKASITASESSSTRRSLKRQKQHYIYNVTDDDESAPMAPDRRQDRQDRSYVGGSSSSPDPFKSQLLKPYEYDTEPSIGGGYPPQQQPSGMRKTFSDTTNSARFHYDPPAAAKSPPNANLAVVATVGRRHTETSRQGPPPRQSVHEAEQRSRSQDPYEQYFDQKDHLHVKKHEQKAHPAMHIFEVPDNLMQQQRLSSDGDVDPMAEIERIARERDRKARPKKRGRSFFEQVRARLAGPVAKFLPGRTRAKSFDDYENRPLEEAPSGPASRDQSQVRHGQQLFVNTEQKPTNNASLARSTSNLTQSQQHSPKGAVVPQSHVVLELIGGPEEERPRYYTIPAEVEAEPAVLKLMQSGKKLHLFEGHTFVAVKPRGRVMCAVCAKKIGGNFSTRQAYQCRDCRMACHKSCHHRTGWSCTSSNAFSMHIEEVDWPEFLRHNQLREFISAVGL